MQNICLNPAIILCITWCISSVSSLGPFPVFLIRTYRGGGFLRLMCACVQPCLQLYVVHCTSPFSIIPDKGACSRLTIGPRAPYIIVLLCLPTWHTQYHSACLELTKNHTHHPSHLAHSPSALLTPCYTALQVVKALHETEETNARLHMYIEGLLANIIDKYPELLERR